MYIPNNDTQNSPSGRLQLVVEMFGPFNVTNQNALKVPKLVKPTNKKN